MGPISPEHKRDRDIPAGAVRKNENPIAYATQEHKADRESVPEAVWSRLPPDCVNSLLCPAPAQGGRHRWRELARGLFQPQYIIAQKN